jgi:hypothetical protein
MASHNLNIHMYSLKELIENIFHLKMPLTIESLKEAKKIVVKMHPDKSRLPSEYFLFYKRAFEMIVDFYKSEHKQNQAITEDTTNYIPENADDSAAASVNHVLKKIPTHTFHQKFNQLFEANMITQHHDLSKNQWFTDAGPQYEIPEQVSSKNMSSVFENIKKKHIAENQLVIKPELEYIRPNLGTNLYEEDDPANSNNGYISSDPFSKLKYDDLRKVHKDQTIFVVGSDPTQQLPYKTVETYMQERGKQTVSPMEKTAAEQIIAQREEARRQQLWAYSHQSKLRSLKNEEKNKSVLSAFLQLRNGGS